MVEYKVKFDFSKEKLATDDQKVFVNQKTLLRMADGIPQNIMYMYIYGIKN